MILKKFRRKKIDFLIHLSLDGIIILTFFNKNNVSHDGIYYHRSCFDSRYRHTRSPGRPCGRRTTPNISGGVLHLELYHRSLLCGFEISTPSINCSFKNDFTSSVCDVENRDPCL